MMTSTRCSCGFTELADETLTDHLERMFTPADNIGNDGQAHYEAADAVRTCACGFTGPLDPHFLTIFTPADVIGSDGRQHQPAEATG